MRDKASRFRRTGNNGQRLKVEAEDRQRQQDYDALLASILAETEAEADAETMTPAGE